MIPSQLIRQAVRSSRASNQARDIVRSRPTTKLRSFHSPCRLLKQKDADDSSFEGSFARTDPSVAVEYPAEHELPSSSPVQGRGGFHLKRTLASFSLEDRVGIVTGGARGLGLVMSQAMVISGADVAIVDLNSKFDNTARHKLRVLNNCKIEEEAAKQSEQLIASFVRENPGAKRLNLVYHTECLPVLIIW